MPKSFGILLQKNFEIELRTWLRTLIEVITVITCFIVIVIDPIAQQANYDLDASETENTKFYAVANLNDLEPLRNLLRLRQDKLRFSLAYAPKNEFAKEVTEAVQKKLNLAGVIGYDTEDLLEDQFDKRIILAGIIYPYVATNIVPDKLSITLRFPSIFRTFSGPTAEELWVTRCSGLLDNNEFNEQDYADEDLYVREGFLQLQHHIFVEWLKRKLESGGKQNVPETPEIPKIPEISVKSFRQYTTKKTCSVMGTSNLLMFLYYLVFLPTFCNLIWKYGRERDENLLVHHWKYGYDFSDYWFAHFIVSFVHVLVLDIFILFIIKISWTEGPASGVFRDIGILYLLAFLMLFSVAMILYAILLVVIVVNARTTVFVGLVLWLTTYALFSILLDHSNGLQSPFVLLTFLLFFNNIFGYGMRYMKNIAAAQEDKAYVLLIILLVEIVLLFLVIMLVQYYSAGRYLAHKPYKLFGFMNCLNRGRRGQPNSQGLTVRIDEPAPEWSNIEYGPNGVPVYVNVRNIGCYYKIASKTLQLKNINFRAFKGEILVLLGHSASGKTTLLNIMAGWKKPALGYIEYLQQNIYTQWHVVSRNVDVCMPNNTLFDKFSAAENLSYHIRIKMTEWHVQAFHVELAKWLDVLKPAIPHRQLLVCDMTFEQKRLLCLCCTLCCNTKIVLLDQPTLHMRLQEQRLFYKILQEEKPERAIILTTYSAEEAERVADRIAILHEGMLKACGSLFYLKSHFVLDYNLYIFKDDDIKSEQVTNLVQSFLPNVTLNADMEDKLVYKIPKEKTPVFQNLLLHLEKEKNKLGIRSIHLVGGELGDILMHLGAGHSNQVFSEYTQKLEITYLSQKALARQQIYAMFYKKLTTYLPSLLPLYALVLSLLIILLTSQMTEVLDVPSKRLNEINLGFNVTETKRTDILGSLGDCTFSAIQHVEKGNILGRINSKTLVFTNKSLACLETNYENHVKTSKSINNKYGAVEKNEASYIAWINQRIFHSAPIALNLLHNMILDSYFENETQALTTIINHPMPIPLRTRISLLDQHLSHIRVPLTIGIIVPLTISFFIIPLVEERRRHLLTLQTIAGVRLDTYWITNFIWDFFMLFICVVIYIIVMTLTTFVGYGMYYRIMTFILIMIYGASALIMTYFISMIYYTSLIRSFLVSFLIQLCTGLCAYVFYWDVIDANRVLFYILSFSPTFSLLDGISNIYTEAKEQRYCVEKCNNYFGCNRDNMCDLFPQCCADAVFRIDQPGIYLAMVYMLISACIFLALMILVEINRAEKKFYVSKSVREKVTACYSYDEKDVVDLKKSIAEPELRAFREMRFVVDQVESYVVKERRELHTISFIADKHDCVALYGAHHCGKTHAIKQFIGEDGFRFGEIYVLGKGIKFDQAEIYTIMGYCPQDYGVFAMMTPYQMMRLFCFIRGVPPPVILEIIADLKQSLDMESFMNRSNRTLNSTQQRKVRLAVSLIAYNKIIILDEPTCGMPAYAKLEIWNFLRYARTCGKTIIIASTDAMECEAIANKVVLFDDGEMLAYGSLRALRAKFTLGFYLDVQLRRDGSTQAEVQANFDKDVQNLHRFVTFLQSDSELITRNDNWFRFYVPVVNVTYSYLYGAMEKNQRRLNISEYTVAQGTMEDVLLNIQNRRKHVKTVRNPRKTSIY